MEKCVPREPTAQRDPTSPNFALLELTTKSWVLAVSPSVPSVQSGRPIPFTAQKAAHRAASLRRATRARSTVPAEARTEFTLQWTTHAGAGPDTTS
jgi:hypothetical protein